MTKSTPGQVDSYNASYFGIGVDRMPEHNKLMLMDSKDWPVDLRRYCTEIANRKEGWCGDIAARAVADWLKTQPKREY